MKLRIARVVLAAFSFGVLVGCGSSGSTSNPPDDLKTPQTPNDAEAPQDGIYRSAASLLKDMPRDAYPKAGPEEGLARAATRKWVKTHLPLRTVEWSATMTGVTVTGDGPFFVAIESDTPWARGWTGDGLTLNRKLASTLNQHSEGPAFGTDVDLGGQLCRLILDYHSGTAYSSANAYSYQCSAQEAGAIKALKGSKVTFRANIREASVGDSARVYNSRTEKFEAVLPINLWISRPSLNGVLPAYDAAGGGGFPAGTFSKVENGELSLLLEPGRATVHRGTTVVLTIMTNAWEESVRVSGPYGDGAEETAFNYSWKYADGILTLNGLDPDNAERGKILSGQWKPK